MSTRFWEVDKGEMFTLWAKYDEFYNVVGYSVSFKRNNDRHSDIVPVTQDSMIVAMADTYENTELEREMMELDMDETAHEEFLKAHQVRRIA